MDRISFGYPVTPEVLRDLFAALAVDFGEELRDVFYFGEARQVISHSGRFAYNSEVLRARASAEQSVSLRFQPDRKGAAHCMVLLPLESGFVGLVFTHNNQPLQLRLFHFCGRVIVRAHLERVRGILDAQSRLQDMKNRYADRERDLEQARRAKARLEERVEELSRTLESVAQGRGLQDFKALLNVARDYEEELRRVKHDFAITVQSNDELVQQIQDLNSTAIPKLAEYETIIHHLRARVAQLEGQQVEGEKANKEAIEARQKLARAEHRIEALDAELARAKADAGGQTRSLETLRTDQTLADLQRRATTAEEEVVRLRQSAERLSESALVLKARLAEEEHRAIKFDLLLRLASEVSNVAGKYRELGFTAAQALEVVRAKLAKLG